MTRWGRDEWLGLFVVLAVIALQVLAWWVDAHYTGPRPPLA